MRWKLEPSPRGEELKRVPLDVHVACPACGGESWDRVEWRSEPDAPTARVRGVVCRACGHEEGPAYYVGRRRWPDPADEDDPPPLPEDPSAAQILDAASFPVYLPVAARLSCVAPDGWSWRPGRLEGVRMRASSRSQSVVVESGLDVLPLSHEERARMRLLNDLRAALPPFFDADHDVTMLKRRAATRPLQAAVDAAVARRVVLSIEREPADFVLVTLEERWVAGAAGILVAGWNVNVGEVALRRLRPDDDLAPPNVPH